MSNARRFSGVSKQSVASRKRRLLVVFPTPISAIGAYTPVKYYLGFFLNLQVRLPDLHLSARAYFQVRSPANMVLGFLPLDKPPFLLREFQLLLVNLLKTLDLTRLWETCRHNKTFSNSFSIMVTVKGKGKVL